jgi:tRNA G46 methylase TrmB
MGGLTEAEPIGIFRAVKTRDAVAQTRDGWPYFQTNFQGMSPSGVPVYEICFGDGQWMLAVAQDLIPYTS